jgi:hypothetical protein
MEIYNCFGSGCVWWARGGNKWCRLALSEVSPTRPWAPCPSSWPLLYSTRGGDFHDLCDEFGGVTFPSISECSLSSCHAHVVAGLCQPVHQQMDAIHNGAQSDVSNGSSWSILVGACCRWCCSRIRYPGANPDDVGCQRTSFVMLRPLWPPLFISVNFRKLSSTGTSISIGKDFVGTYQFCISNYCWKSQHSHLRKTKVLLTKCFLSSNNIGQTVRSLTVFGWSICLFVQFPYYFRYMDTACPFWNKGFGSWNASNASRLENMIRWYLYRVSRWIATREQVLIFWFHGDRPTSKVSKVSNQTSVEQGCSPLQLLRVLRALHYNACKHQHQNPLLGAKLRNQRQAETRNALLDYFCVSKFLWSTSFLHLKETFPSLYGHIKYTVVVDTGI